MIGLPCIFPCAIYRNHIKAAFTAGIVCIAIFLRCHGHQLLLPPGNRLLRETERDIAARLDFYKNYYGILPGNDIDFGATESPVALQDLISPAAEKFRSAGFARFPCFVMRAQGICC